MLLFKILIITFLLFHYIVYISNLIMGNTIIEIDNKKDFILWLIPFYMPIKLLINQITDIYNDLE